MNKDKGQCVIYIYKNYFRTYWVYITRDNVTGDL